jgi:hypothetical protein
MGAIVLALSDMDGSPSLGWCTSKVEIRFYVEPTPQARDVGVWSGQDESLP